MELQVIINQKKGVINITSEQFIIEDLKAHICNKMGLDTEKYKTKIVCGSRVSIELIQTPSFSFNQESVQKKEAPKVATVATLNDMLKESFKLKKKWKGRLMTSDYDVTNEVCGHEVKEHIYQKNYRRILKTDTEGVLVGMVIDSGDINLLMGESVLPLFNQADSKSIDKFFGRLR